MASIIYFRQRRVDGGTRTGVDIAGETVLERFDEGAGEHDPALLWYVDVRCEGRRLPRTAEGAQRWLLDQHPVITRGLRQMADELATGIDIDIWPLQKVIYRRGGTTITVACSAMKRVAAQNIARMLQDTAGTWSDDLVAMSVDQPA